ncbi:MAG TPA: antibiotic biosynthesis monooxygenase [Chloroflexota bacterium]|nr:antibiotic biosynthesis monooxygenase [Chloroflexota bacterium]
MNTFFSAGTWTLKEGHAEQEFIHAWLGSVDMDPPIEGLRVRPRLLGDLGRPGRFLSFAEWESREAIERFRARPDFARVMSAIREHEEFTIHTLQEVA